MTKIREPLSIEKILKDLIGKLKENEIKEFTGKSISHFRKCSDPDDKDHNLHLADAIKLDMLSLKSQNGSPFLDNISLIVNNEFNEQEKLERLQKIIIKRLCKLEADNFDFYDYKKTIEKYTKEDDYENN